MFILWTLETKTLYVKQSPVGLTLYVKQSPVGLANTSPYHFREGCNEHVDI